jgi:hypothetical protein
MCWSCPCMKYGTLLLCQLSLLFRWSFNCKNKEILSSEHISWDTVTMGLTIWCVEAAPVESMELYYYVNYHFYLGRASIARVEKLSVLNIFLGILLLGAWPCWQRCAVASRIPLLKHFLSASHSSTLCSTFKMIVHVIIWVHRCHLLQCHSPY